MEPVEVEKLSGRSSGFAALEAALETPFTPRSRGVLELSLEEVRQLGHDYIGTEHLLLGLVRGGGFAGRALKNLGIDLAKARTQVLHVLGKDARVEVEKVIECDSGFAALEAAFEIPFTPRAKRVLELSREEAHQLGHNYIGTEHLLLGLIGEGEGVTARVLENLGVNWTWSRCGIKCSAYWEELTGRAGYLAMALPPRDSPMVAQPW